MNLQRTINAYLRAAGHSGYIAECPELRIRTHGGSLNEVTENLRDRVERALNGEDLARLGFAPSPVVVVTFEIEPRIARGASESPDAELIAVE
jgi:hypothetical protein